MNPKEQMELYERFRKGDNDALGALYRHYWPPPDQDGEHLVEWAMRTFDLPQSDAEDVVASWWTTVVEEKPAIHRSFRAYAYQGIRWRVLNLWRKRNSGGKPWNKPWAAKTNEFRPPGARPKSEIWRAEGTVTIADARYRTAHLAHLVRLAALHVAMHRLAPKAQQAVRLYWLEDHTLEQAASVARMTLWPFRKLEQQARNDLREEIHRIEGKIEFAADQTKLLEQWGDVRTDLHWVPDDKNQECDCSRCEQSRREATLHGSGVVQPKSKALTDLRFIITDEDGYKLPARRLRGTSLASPIIRLRMGEELLPLVASRA